MSGTIPVDPSSQFSSAAFSNMERVWIRKFCGYPPYGPGISGFQSWRFFVAYGQLEFRLTNMAPEEFQTTRYYLSQLYTLDPAIAASGANLDTDAAAVWTHNKNEVPDRIRLFNYYRQQLLEIVGAPPGPSFSPRAKGAIVI